MRPEFIAAIFGAIGLLAIRFFVNDVTRETKRLQKEIDKKNKASKTPDPLKEELLPFTPNPEKYNWQLDKYNWQLDLFMEQMRMEKLLEQIKEEQARKTAYYRDHPEEMPVYHPDYMRVIVHSMD